MASLEQFQSPNFVNQAPISCEEITNLKGQTSDPEMYLDNSEKLGVTSLQLREQLRLSEIEVNNRIKKFLQIDGAVEN